LGLWLFCVFCVVCACRTRHADPRDRRDDPGQDRRVRRDGRPASDRKAPRPRSRRARADDESPRSRAEDGAAALAGARDRRRRGAPGGGVGNWGPLRRAVSRAGCLYAQAWLGFGVRDSTSGFRVFRREVLEAIDLEAIETRGYAFQVETTYRAHRAGFRIAEVPITFVDRTEGRSKMTRAIVAEAALKVPALRLASAFGRL
jgi:hypothetical protein